MSSQVPLPPQDPDPSVGANPMRAGAPSAPLPFDDDDLRKMLFRSECFAEDLIDAYAVH